MTHTIAIRLDVFSGRPNPEWTVERDAVPRLLAALDALSPAAAAQPMPDGLGFRGYDVIVSGDDGTRTFHVFGSRIQQGARAYSDPRKTVEGVILSTMPEALRKEFADILPR